MTSPIATITEAGFNGKERAFDVFLRNQTIGLVIYRGNGTVRALFSETRASQRKFTDMQSAIGYLIERKERRLANSRAA